VESEGIGKGSVFCVKIPFDPAQGKPMAQDQAKPLNPAEVELVGK